MRTVLAERMYYLFFTQSLRTLSRYVYRENMRSMIDWNLVVGFDWDAGDSRKSADKHGVSQIEAEQILLSEGLLLVRDPGHSQQEPRFHALGETDEGRRLHVTFTLRAAGTLIRIISARDMHRKERTVYDDAKKGST